MFYFIFLCALFSEPPRLNEVLSSHHAKFISEEVVNRMNINRETLWEDSIITFKNPKFDAWRTLRVRFAGEAGLDAGGLRIEYCSEY